MSLPDPRIPGYLGRALSLELSAVQTYSTQARLVAGWGLDEAARRFREESLEEMQHVERIIARMLALGMAPNASCLRPAAVGSTLHALLQQDYEFETELMQLYHDAASYCAHAGHSVDRAFFQTLLEEEQAHARALTSWLAELDKALEPASYPGMRRVIHPATRDANRLQNPRYRRRT